VTLLLNFCTHIRIIILSPVFKKQSDNTCWGGIHLYITSYTHRRTDRLFTICTSINSFFVTSLAFIGIVYRNRKRTILNISQKIHSFIQQKL